MNLHMNIKLAVAALFVPLLMCAQGQKAVVNAGAAFLRQGPDYESPLETQELMGRVVEVLERDGYWVKVATSQPYTAWVNERQLAMLDGGGVALWEQTPKYMVTAMHSAAYEFCRQDSQVVCTLVAGDLLAVDGRKRSGMLPVALPDGRRGWVPAGDVADAAAWSGRCSALKAAGKCELAISYAFRMVGTAYLWGGMSADGCDCSGLVRLCYLMAEVGLPRNASQQYAAGRDIPVGRNDDGTFDMSALKRGDLVFFGSRTPEKLRITHVGIYLGNGRMIQSSQIVRVNSLVPGREDFYENAGRLVAACRIVE